MASCSTVSNAFSKSTNAKQRSALNYLHDCIVSQSVTVLVGNGEDYFVPTAFSPNGDGNNDLFMIYGSGLAKANLKIFNRWGEKVFDSQNQWLGWDGTYKGKVQELGTFVYYAHAIDIHGKNIDRKGNITLVR